MNNLTELCKLIRYDILTSTTTAGSGHPTSSLSAVELMATLFFDGFYHYDLDNPSHIFNDRLIFSKGHASPLFYSLYHAAGVISTEELLSLRKFDSVLEGHPTPRFKYTEAATGSLGQGLSIGLGMVLGIKLHTNRLQSAVSSRQSAREPKVFVLLGDSEMAEGQVWEAMEVAAYHKVNNLVAIVDVNRLGQRGETMLGWDLETYKKRAEAFGWNAIIIEDGHNLEEIKKTYDVAMSQSQSESVTDFNQFQPISTHKPTMIIAKTKKGKGISLFEDKDNWHGKPVPKDKLNEALKEIGDLDKNIRGTITKPKDVEIGQSQLKSVQSTADSNRLQPIATDYTQSSLTATREAYGDALVALGKTNDRMLVIDAELSNSTFANKFQQAFPDRFFEMFIAEQNMVSVALGLNKMGFTVFTSTFASFFSRAFDQIRMGQYTKLDLKMVGSHAGVFMGPDGSSQMGLEDFAMMRSILESTVLSPADAVATAQLTQCMVNTPGISYMRIMRDKLPLIYPPDEPFEVGKSKVLKQSNTDVAVIFATGVTLHQALMAYNELQKQNIAIAVVDIYSIKPIDTSKIKNLTSKIKNVIVVEDHYPAGGLGEAVLSALSTPFPLHPTTFTHLCVHKTPRSGTPEELLAYEEIDAAAIVKAVQRILS